jgi:hypothetical protein
MTSRHNPIQLNPAEVDRISRILNKHGEVSELIIEELEDRIAPGARPPVKW